MGSPERSRPQWRARCPRPPRPAQLHALQRRATAGRNARALAAELPAHCIWFDVLQSDGQELLDELFERRREVLEVLFADHWLGAPWTLFPSTTDLAVAEEWLYEWTDVPGLEGVVGKSLTGRYRPGMRGWTKVRRRNSTEHSSAPSRVPCTAPQVLLLSRYDTNRPPTTRGQDRSAETRPGPGPRRPPSRGWRARSSGAGPVELDDGISAWRGQRTPANETSDPACRARGEGSRDESQLLQMTWRLRPDRGSCGLESGHRTPGAGPP
ncbi:hypothetical protein ACIQM3_20880 [Streptomyces sp. NPDC091271]|uniref:ATP-dependent DNA ligase n=1 Tax=Streptomyces sp. NPDC091271 TaxID=3365980 RepID=UPI0038055D8F